MDSLVAQACYFREGIIIQYKLYKHEILLNAFEEFVVGIEILKMELELTRDYLSKVSYRRTTFQIVGSLSG